MDNSGHSMFSENVIFKVTNIFCDFVTNFIFSAMNRYITLFNKHFGLQSVECSQLYACGIAYSVLDYFCVYFYANFFNSFSLR